MTDDDIRVEVARLEGKVDGLERNDERHERDMRTFAKEAGIAVLLQAEVEKLWEAVRSLRLEQSERDRLAAERHQLEKDARRWRINTYFVVASLTITLVLGILALVLR